MEIIDKFSRTLGLTEKEESEAQSSAPEELQSEQPQQNEPPIQQPPIMPRHNVVDFNSARAARDDLMTNDNNNVRPMVKTKITTVRPKTFDEDAKIIADCLREDIPVIVNLEETNPEHARRIIDFALGTTYAIDGDVQQVSEAVFVCTPKTVMVTFNKEEVKKEKDFSWLTGKI